MPIFPDGVYFNLPEAEYHSDPALGSSDHAALARDPYSWQYQRLNPEPLSEDYTSAKLLGSAVHSLLLEGEEAFAERYPVKPEQEDFENLLVTIDDLRSYAAAHAIALTGLKKKEDMVAAILGAEPAAPIWDALLARWKDGLASGARPISRKQARLAYAVRRFAHANPSIGKTAFEDGCPEVSIIWSREDGLRLKARIDFLKIPATVDVKTFSSKGIADPSVAIRSAIAAYDLHVQRAHYEEARRMILPLARAKKLRDPCPQGLDWLRGVVAEQDPAWVWVFTRTDGMPAAYARQPGVKLSQAGKAAVERARQNYTELAAEFGPDDEWIPTHEEIPPVVELSDLPFYFRMKHEDAE